LGVTTLLQASKLNHSAVFESGLIFGDIRNVQKPTWDLNASTNLNLTFKTGFTFDAIHNCRPTTKWYSTPSTVFLIWGWENVKSSMCSRRVLEYSPYIFYQ